MTKTKKMSLLIITLWFVWLVFYSLRTAINIPTFHLDGAYQTASGLYRLYAGMLPGRDFFPYLGIGPTLLLYPIFLISGAHISASVFSAHFITLLVCMLGTSLIWHLVWGSKSLITTIAICCVILATTITLNSFFGMVLPSWFDWAISPGYSLRPLRASVPYIILLIYYFLIPRTSNYTLRYTLYGVLVGVALLWSNDFGLPTATMLYTLVVLTAYVNKEFSKRNILIFTGALLFFWLGSLWLITQGHVIELLKYNFQDVAKDQWWYFAPYAEHTRIFHVDQIFRLFSLENYFPSIVFVSLVICAMLFKTRTYLLLSWVGLVLFAGGTVASIGGHLGGYFGGFYYWGITTSIFMLLHILYSKVLYRPGARNFSIIRDFLLSAGLILSLAYAIHTYSKFVSESSSAKKDGNRIYVKELGGYLGKEWRGYVNLARKFKGATVFEEYWGIWSAIQKTFPNWPVDSVIHALGNTRKDAVQQLKNADIIISTRNSATQMWQTWNVSTNYWFYRQLIDRWNILYVSPKTTVWMGQTESRILPERYQCFFDEISHKLSLSVPKQGFYELNIRYTPLKQASRKLLMVQNNINFGGDADGFVSLNANSNIGTFPIYLETKNANLETKILPQQGERLNVTECYVRNINYQDEDVLSSSGFFLTDENWIRGIARRWAGFFVPNKKQYISMYRPGRQILLPNGETRNILKVVSSDATYLNIFVSGDILDQELIKTPEKLRVIDNKK